MPAVTPTTILELPIVRVTDERAIRFRPVRTIVTAIATHEGEGFPVRRPFPGLARQIADPFILLDQMGEVQYAPGEAKGAPDHPHRGFETVTYMIDGEFVHRDSTGGGGVIANGATQWMTAGAGIVHSEMPPEKLVRSGGLFHGVQLWVNLPAAEKWTPPRYQDIAASAVALLRSEDGGALLRVIAGEVASRGGHPRPVAYAHDDRRQPSRRAVAGLQRAVYALSGIGRVGASSALGQAGCGLRPGKFMRRALARTTAPRSTCSRWTADRRAGGPVRAVRDEHARRSTRRRRYRSGRMGRSHGLRRPALKPGGTVNAEAVPALLDIASLDPALACCDVRGLAPALAVATSRGPRRRTPSPRSGAIGCRVSSIPR